jgi:hypothetical protein
MPKLISMKIDQAARESRYAEKSIAMDAPSYPYGLTVNLDTDSLEKLEIDAADLEVGSTMTLVAEVEIVSAGKSSTAGGGESQNASLQITRMLLEDAPAKDAAAALYKE